MKKTSFLWTKKRWGVFVCINLYAHGMKVCRPICVFYKVNLGLPGLFHLVIENIWPRRQCSVWFIPNPTPRLLKYLTLILLQALRSQFVLKQFPPVWVQETYFCIRQLQKPYEPLNHKAHVPKTWCFTEKFQASNHGFHGSHGCADFFSLKARKKIPWGLDLPYLFKIIIALLTARAQHFRKQKVVSKSCKNTVLFKATSIKITAIC